MKNSNSNLPPAVAEMSLIPLTGNIVAPMWFKTITLESGRPDTNSILILSDIVYWYRPTEIRDERSGSVIGQKKKFAEDMLRRSYADLEEQFGLSKKQCRDCLIRLENLGVIRRVLRNINTSTGVRNNVMYINLIPSVLSKLTNPTSQYVDNSSVKTPSNFKVTTSLHESYEGSDVEVTRVVSQKLLGTDIEVTTNKETNTTSSNTSLSKNQTSSENSRPVSMKVEREEFSNSKKMMALWNELIPEKATNANSYLLSKLEIALRDQLDGDISSWRTTCENFRSSKFLMGEVENQRLNPSLSLFVSAVIP